MQFSTGLIVLLTVLGIVFHYLQKQQAEEDDREQKNSSLSSSSSASSSDQQNSSLSSSLSDQQQFLHEDEDGQRKDYSYDQLNRQQAEDDIVEQKNSSLSSPLDQRSALEEDSERKDLSSSSLLDKRCQRFSLAKIKLATNDFDDNLLIGEGGFGKVYKGKIEFEEEGIDVAIKRLNLDSHQGVTEFRAEIEMLSTFRHSHIVSLLGYHEGSDKKEMILVYEYMPNGSLEDHLHKRRANASNSSLLTWIQRLHICIGAARGLDYLHTGTGVQSRVIHRDVKSSNILLDGNLAAKIADFGLSRIGPANHTGTTNVYTDHIKGTFGYMDAESYATRRLTRKSDVYAFGVVLLEVLCGRPALDFTLDEEQHSLAVWANNCIREGNIDRIIDPCLTGQMSADCLNEFGQIACECILTSSKDRPTMTKIVARLEFVLALGSRKHGGVTIAEKMWSLFSMKIPAVHAINYRNRQKRSNDNKSKRVIQDKAATTVPEGRSEGKDTGIILVDPLKEAAEGSNGNINKSVTTEDPIPFMTAEEGSSVINKVATTEVECHDAATMLKDQPSSSQNLKIFTFNELQRATLNFRRYTKSDVYDAIVCKGWVDSASYAPSASGIAIDVLMKLSYGDPAKNRKRWEEELNLVMGTTSHPNVVKLLGYCWASDRFFLVYEDTQNGSLYKYLFGEVAELLTWDTRMKIAMGAAQGLAFLHTRENNVISTILTSKNILLDREFNAKLTDFGDVGLDPAAIYESSSLPLPDGYEYFAPEYVLTGLKNRGRWSNDDRSKQPKVDKSATKKELAEGSNVNTGKDPLITQNGTHNLKIFTFDELRRATRNFRPSATLGVSDDGSVFRGWVDRASYAPSVSSVGIAVAINIANTDNVQSLDEWQAEVNRGKFSHPNLVKLLGYCSEDGKLLLVHEYIPKRNFIDIVHRYPLPWSRTMKIAIGVAKGLAFLHNHERQSTPIFRTFNASNILLNENDEAKLYFGWASLGRIPGSLTVLMSNALTILYNPPEYMATGLWYVKSDVYAFGVMMLGMLAGLGFFDDNRCSSPESLVEWARTILSDNRKLQRVMDPWLEQGIPPKGASKAA